MDSARIDGGVATVLRARVAETFYLHIPEADEINVRSGFRVNKHAHRGVAFKVPRDSTYKRITSLAQRIRPEGYRVYRSRMGFGGEPDEICVLFSPDQMDILRYEQTNGVNFDITTDSLIQVLGDWNKELDLVILGASSDWVDAAIVRDSINYTQLAERVYQFCPDVVDQGAGSIKALAEEMKRNRMLYLWWD